MTFKAVIFDLDGTLLNSLEDLADAVNSVLEKQGFPERSLKEYNYLVGQGTRRLIERALPEEARSERIIDACLQVFFREYYKNWDNKTRPYGGIVSLLQQLNSRGIPLSIFSNKPDDLTKKCAGRFFPEIDFEAVRGQRNEVPPKPDPCGAVLIAEQLQSAPKDILFIGDTKTDMLTAVAAGMYPVGVLWGFRTKEELLEHGAKMLVEKPEEILSVVNGIAYYEE